MIGFPKHLNSVDDYENIHALALAGEADRERVKKAWQCLLDTRKHYEFDHVMTADEDPPGGEPDYRVYEETDESGASMRTLFRLVTAPNSKLKRLGLTVTAVNAKIAELEVA